MISDEELLDLCRALVSAVRSGLALSDAFETIGRDPRRGRALRRAAGLIGGGRRLHEAFAAQGVFPPVFLALLRAGEEGGKIDDFLEIYADCLEVRVNFRRRIGRLLVYPVFAAVLAAALFLLVSFKVMPAVLEPLMKSGAPLPPQAFLFTRAAEWLYASWYKILAIGAPALLLLRALLRSGPGRKLTGLAGHWLPVARYATAEGRLYYIYTTLALLLKAGLQPGAMMDVLAQFSQDDLITGRRLRRAAVLLAGGETFARSLADLLPEEDRRAVEVAEKAGRLDDTLFSRAKLHYDRHLHRLKQLTTAFNISTLVAIALLCFGLVLTVAWPAVSMLSGTRGAMQGLGLSTEPEAAPAPRPLPPAEAPSEDDLKTRAFNEKYGRRVADLLRGGAPAEEPREQPAREQAPEPEAAPAAGPAESKPEEAPKKKLKGKIDFNGSPTGISPAGIGR